MRKKFLSKKEELIRLFDRESKIAIETVLQKTGIVSLGALKIYIHELRKEKIINLRTKFGFVIKD